MERGLDSSQLRVNVSGIMRRPFARSRLRAGLLLCRGERGMVEDAAGSPVLLDLELESAPDGVRVRGSITGLLPATCTRCAAPFQWRLELDVDEFFCRSTLPLLTPQGPRESEIPAEDVYLLDGDTIDLNDMVNDLILLSLPIRMLCRKDCRGICPRCGADLNQGDCDCRSDEVDPRLEVLRRWLDREGEQ